MADVVENADVWVCQPGDRLRLAPETRAELRRQRRTARHRQGCSALLSVIEATEVPVRGWAVSVYVPATQFVVYVTVAMPSASVMATIIFHQIALQLLHMASMVPRAASGAALRRSSRDLAVILGWCVGRDHDSDHRSLPRIDVLDLGDRFRRTRADAGGVVRGRAAQASADCRRLETGGNDDRTDRQRRMGTRYCAVLSAVFEAMTTASKGR